MLRLSSDKKKFQFEQSVCHSRLNTFGRLALTNRYHTSINGTNKNTISYNNIKSQSKTSKILLPKISKDKDYGASNKRSITQASIVKKQSHKYNRSNLLDKTIQDYENPEQTQRINKQVQMIKKLSLLGSISVKHVKYQGHIKIPTVYNDYHSSSSNPGYSRKPDGGIYPK